MWITELTLANADENVRADWFETALTLYFSYPSIEGIILWGFWDHGVSSDGALVNGNYFYVGIEYSLSHKLLLLSKSSRL